jgi:hypothetical protein
VKEGKEFDEKAFGEELSKFEHKWTESHTKYPAEPLELKLELPNVSGVPVRPSRPLERFTSGGWRSNGKFVTNRAILSSQIGQIVSKNKNI